MSKEGLCLYKVVEGQHIVKAEDEDLIVYRANCPIVCIALGTLNDLQI